MPLNPARRQTGGEKRPNLQGVYLFNFHVQYLFFGPALIIGKVGDEGIISSAGRTLPGKVQRVVKEFILGVVKSINPFFISPVLQINFYFCNKRPNAKAPN